MPKSFGDCVQQAHPRNMVHTPPNTGRLNSPNPEEQGLNNDGESFNVCPAGPQRGPRHGGMNLDPYQRPVQPQRCRSKTAPCFFNACLARPVLLSEVSSNPKARAAMDAEGARLRVVRDPTGNSAFGTKTSFDHGVKSAGDPRTAVGKLT